MSDILRRGLPPLLAVVAGAGLGTLAMAETDPAGLELQTRFDPIGAEVHEMKHGERAVYFIDEGPRDGRVTVFIGGQGTSLEAFQLTEFARSTREALGLRMISVERNGFGESPFDPALGYQDYAAEVLAVLDARGVDRFSIIAISGGGAYAAHLAQAAGERLVSLHLAVASSRTLPNRTAPNCTRTPEEALETYGAYTRSPKDWWGVPGSPVLVIPGWQARAYADATRSFYVAGQMGDPAALAHEYLLPCGDKAIADVSGVTAPVYLYYGEADTSVPVDHMEEWQAAVQNVARATVYPGEGHTAQYRHWDQILVDLAGLGDHTVVCQDGRSRLVPNAEVAADAFLGICAWKDAQLPE